MIKVYSFVMEIRRLDAEGFASHISLEDGLKDTVNWYVTVRMT